MSHFGAFLTKNAIFWLAVDGSFQIEACFVFICVSSSHHKTCNLKHEPQVAVWHRLKICATCLFLAILGLISHEILYETPPTPVIAWLTTHISSKHRIKALYVVSYSCYEYKLAILHVRVGIAVTQNGISGNFLHKYAYLSPLTSILANSKCIGPLSRGLKTQCMV